MVNICTKKNTGLYFGSNSPLAVPVYYFLWLKWMLNYYLMVCLGQSAYDARSVVELKSIIYSLERKRTDGVQEI